MTQMTFELWIILTIGLFFSLVALWYLLSDKYNKSRLNNFIIYTSILFMIIALLMFNIVGGIEKAKTNESAAVKKQIINQTNKKGDLEK